MMLQGAVAPQSLVIIQAEITDSEGIMWLHLVVYSHVSFLHEAIQQFSSKSDNTSNGKGFQRLWFPPFFQIK